MEKKNQEFIDFLRNEFKIHGFYACLRADTENDEADLFVDSHHRLKNKKELYNRSKLQKVLDGFIESAESGQHEFIDQELIDKWHQANQTQKQAVVDSFVKNHRKINLDWKNYDLDQLNFSQLSQWKTALAFAIVFAVFLTSTVAVGNPGLINDIGREETKILYKLLRISPPEKNLILVQDIEKSELSGFIKENYNRLRIPSYRNKKTITIDPYEIRGRVAGAYEPLDQTHASESGKNSILSKASRLMDRLAHKQIELSLKLNEKIKEILK